MVAVPFYGSQSDVRHDGIGSFLFLSVCCQIA